MGRNKKSIADHIKNGTYRPSRHGPLPVIEVPLGPGEVIDRPPSLTGRAAEVWDELTSLLGGVLRRRDIPAMVELCRWIERSERIAETLDAIAPSDKTFKTLLVSAGIATDKVAMLTTRFGLTPADRARLKADVASVVNNPQKAKVRPKQFGGESGPPKK